MIQRAESPTNCPACGRTILPADEMPNHQPVPNATESDRCTSRPKKYANLRCHHAAGHECTHSARVSGTGLHHWRDDLAT